MSEAAEAVFRLAARSPPPGGPATVPVAVDVVLEVDALSPPPVVIVDLELVDCRELPKRLDPLLFLFTEDNEDEDAPRPPVPVVRPPAAPPGPFGVLYADDEAGGAAEQVD